MVKLSSKAASAEEEKSALVLEFKNIILKSLEAGKEASFESNRNLTFDNGFTEGFLTCTQLLMEGFSQTADIAILETGLEGFHRAAHLLFGEFKEESGKCKFLSSYNRVILDSLIKKMLGQVMELSVKEEISSPAASAEPTRKPN